VRGGDVSLPPTPCQAALADAGQHVEVIDDVIVIVVDDVSGDGGA
jgi:hypothetical protein